MPADWNAMSLEHIKAFGKDFSVKVERINPQKIKVGIKYEGKKREHFVKSWQEIKNITLK